MSRNNENRAPVACSVNSRGRKTDALPARWKDFLIIGLVAALVISISFAIMPAALFGFGKVQTTVNITVSEEFNAQVFDDPDYVDAPDYYVNGMAILLFFMDDTIINIIENTFEENESAIIDTDILDNETVGFGYSIYFIPAGVPANGSIEGTRHSITMESKIMVVSIELSLTNTTDDFDVAGGLENQSDFIEELFAGTMNKTFFEEKFPSLFYDGTFDIILTGCQYGGAYTRIGATVNGDVDTFKEEFFVSP